MNFWKPVDYINKLIDFCIDFLKSKSGIAKAAETQYQKEQNIKIKDNKGKIQQSIINNYHYYQYYINPKDIPVSGLSDTSVTGTVYKFENNDEEIEEAVNQYIESEIVNNKESN
jgi:hypothetical protein